ncbi:hypothetical protein CHARACLAT_029994 [Characodon lateralis]|uniref:Uncharacterized protein n=1 Tax=Characodon lateralis TaxID=208331 RepID=A0ABU7D4S2_9TELE|nr:hypothetical protein [Characodon lateralis]
MRSCTLDTPVQVYGVSSSIIVSGVTIALVIEIHLEPLAFIKGVVQIMSAARLLVRKYFEMVGPVWTQQSSELFVWALCIHTCRVLVGM